MCLRLCVYAGACMCVWVWRVCVYAGYARVGVASVHVYVVFSFCVQVHVLFQVKDDAR